VQKNTYTTFRVLKEDAQKLKIIAALSRQSMLQSFKRLVQQEYDRLQQEGGKRHAADQKDQA
jgi:L-lactate utilization protein LutB